MGELLIGFTKYFSVYNGERQVQLGGGMTLDAVYASSTGGRAMIVDKYGATPELPIVLRSTATEFGEVGVEQNAKIAAEPSSCVKSGAN